VIDKNQAESAPDFTALDSEGVEIKLSAYKAISNVLLVFNRGFG
jgi:peroxiredoxin